MRRSARTIVALAGLLCMAGVQAGTTDHEYTVTVLGGVETNPLAVAEDGPNGVFAQASIDGYLTREIGPALAAFLDGAIQTRAYESPVADADATAGELRAGMAYAPTRPALDKLTLLFGGTYAAYRTTFVDRETGGPYEVDADPDPSPPSTIAIGDRLDHDALGLFVEARWRQGRRLRYFLNSSLERTNYLEDYTATTNLEPLDYRSLRLEPGVDWKVNDVARLVVSVELTDRDYDAQPALDKSGTVVPGATRSYRYARYRVQARVTPSDRWKIIAGLADSDRDDVYAGYYDYGALSAYLAIDRRVGSTGQLRAYASSLDVDYPRATVAGTASGELRSSDERRYYGRYEHELGERLRWFAEAGAERTDSRDPIYAYDSDWFQAGIRFGK